MRFSASFAFACVFPSFAFACVFFLLLFPARVIFLLSLPSRVCFSVAFAFLGHDFVASFMFWRGNVFGQHWLRGPVLDF